MTDKKFDPKKLRKLNNPKRLVDIPPDYISGKLDTANPDVMIEIGAGTAFFCIAFFERLKPSTLYACDISDVMIDWMTENVVPKYPGIIPVKSEEHAVDLDDGIADVVFMICLHHELEHPSRSLRESRRLLKPGGEIFIIDWKKMEMPEGPPEAIRCRPEDVADQLTESGFSRVSMFNELPKHFLVVGKKDPELT